jgi:uncharacterized protein YcfJ
MIFLKQLKQEKIMKKQFFALSVALISLVQAPEVVAGRYNQEGFYDSAKVVNVEPIVRKVWYQRPHEECYRKEPSHKGRRSYTSVIGGGLIGGVIGNRFGKGHGREVMTIAGTLLGASIGDDLYRGRGLYRQSSASRKVCDVRYSSHTEEEVSGYHVTYRYKGKLFERQMDRHPGRKLRVWIGVTPVG